MTANTLSLGEDYFDNAIEHCRLPIYFNVKQYASGHASLTSCNSKILSNLGGGCHYKREKNDRDNRSEQSIQRNIRRMKKTVRESCKRFAADHMVTLTTRENIKDFDTALKVFRDYVKELKKQNILNHYVAVPERQKRGAWHWHIAVKGFVSVNQWREIWQLFHGGKGSASVNVSYNKKYSNIEQTEYMFNYLSKYISKAIDADYDVKVIRSRRLPSFQIRKGFCGSLTWLVRLINESYQFRSIWQSDDYDVSHFNLYAEHDNSFGYICFMYETDKEGIMTVEFSREERFRVNAAFFELFGYVKF